MQQSKLRENIRKSVLSERNGSRTFSMEAEKERLLQGGKVPTVQYEQLFHRHVASDFGAAKKFSDRSERPLPHLHHSVEPFLSSFPRTNLT